MRFGAVTIVSSLAGAVTVLMLVLVLIAVHRLRREMKDIRQRVEAEQQRRAELRRKVEGPDRPRLRLVHRLPPTLLVLSALTLESVKRHPLPSLGLTTAAAGLAASAVLITHPAVRPPATTNPERAVVPVTAVHAPAPGRTTPARKEPVPAGTQSPDVPAGTATSPVSLPTVIVPTPRLAPSHPPTSSTPPRRVIPIPVRSLVPSTVGSGTGGVVPSVCVTVAAIPVCV